MPGARCARSRACRVESTRVSHHGHTGITRHSPRNGLTVSFVLLVIGLLSPSLANMALHSRSGSQKPPPT
jgi:hypothetical protein